MNREQTLRSACDAVLRDRQRTHGPIEDSFGLIAALWSAYLSIPVTPFAVANLMTLLKIARARGNPSHADNQVDGAGYQACAAELADAMEANINASTPNAAPPAPQTPPEGDHSQSQVEAQDGAIPDDCSDVWHNPENYPLTEEEKAAGWRFLTKDETVLTWWTGVKMHRCGRIEVVQAAGEDRNEELTYFTKAPLPLPLPQTASKASDDAISAIQESCTAPARKTDYSVIVSGDPELKRLAEDIATLRKDTGIQAQRQAKSDKFRKQLEDLEQSNRRMKERIPLPGAPAPTAFAGALSTPPPVQPAPAEPQWHNPEGLTLTDEDKAAGWRFLTPGEDILPPDTEVTDTRGKWIDSRFVGRNRYPRLTYRTRTPLPGAADADDNLHQTTP